MPAIPVYQQRTSAEGPTQLSRASTALAGGQGLAAVGQALGEVANDALQMRLFEQRQAEERAAVWANEQAMGYRSTWVDRFRQMQEGASEDGSGFQASVLEEFDSGAKELEQGAPTPASRDWIRGQLARQRLALQEEASAFELQRDVEFKVGGLTRSIDSARISAQARPQDFDTLAAELNGAIAASGLSDKARSVLREQSSQAVAAAAVTGMIERDPHATLKQLNTEKPSSRTVRVLSYDQRTALRRQAESEIARRESEAKHAQAETKQALGERVRDAVTAYRLGLDFDAPPSRADFVMALGKEDGAKAYENFTQEQQLGADLQALATMSPEDQAQLLANRAPTGTSGVAEGAERYRVLAGQANHLNTLRETDPAAYVTKYSEPVRQAFAQSAASPEALQAYATATLAEQRRLGVQNPKLLPNDVASSIAQSFSTGRGEDIAAMVQSEQQKWGSHWPRVFGELAAKKMPSAALAIGRGMEPGASIRLAGVAALPMEELQKGVEIPPADIRESLTAHMIDFQRSLDGVIGGEKTFAGMYDAAQRLAYSYLRQGMSMADATGQAYNDVLGDHYAFRDVNGRTFRVPVEQDSDAIERGAQLAIERLRASDLLPPLPTSTSNAEQAASDLKDAITKRGYWVTSADGERGLALFIDGAPVLRQDGLVYQLTWDQLRAEQVAEQERSRKESELAFRMRSSL